VFYSSDQPCPLPRNPLKAIVTPRPIGWISTVDEHGVVNLAPYSFFNLVCADPGVLVFSSETTKDSATNAANTGEFVFSLSTVNLQHEMSASSAAVDASVDEFELSGLEKASSVQVAPPRVAASPAALECKTLSTQTMKDLNGEPINVTLVFGQVVGVYIHDDFVTENGRFDTAKAQPLSRCGYRDYAAVESVFEMKRPDD